MEDAATSAHEHPAFSLEPTMHPTRDDLAGLIFGTLAEDQAEGVADHVEQCRSCEETMQELETASNDVI